MEWRERLAGRPRILRDAQWVGLGQVTAALARLIGLRVLTGLVSPTVYGHAALLLGIGALGTGTFLSPFHQACIRFYPEAANEGRVEALRKHTRRTLWASALAFTALLLLGGWVWSLVVDWGAATPLALILLVGVLLTDMVRTFETNLLGAARRQRAWSAWTALDAWARPIGAIAAVWFLGPSVESIFLGYMTGGAVTNLAFSKAVVRGADTGTPGLDPAIRQMRGEFMSYALPLVPLAIVGWVVGYSDRYILGGIAGSAAVGKYAAIYGLGGMPFLFLGGIGLNTLRPVLFDALATGDRAKERATVLAWLSLVGLVSAIGVIAMGAFSDLITRLALGEEFRPARELLVWIAAAHAFIVVQQVFETMIYSQQRTQRLLLVQSASAAMALVFYALLIPSMGAKGAAIGTFAAAVASCGLYLFAAEAPRRVFLPRGR